MPQITIYITQEQKLLLLVMKTLLSSQY